jgi:hypothetical protein
MWLSAKLLISLAGWLVDWGKLVSTARENWKKAKTQDGQSVKVYSKGGKNYVAYK